MPENENKKPKAVRPRRKASAGAIKVSRPKRKAEAEHVIDLKTQPLVSIPPINEPLPNPVGYEAFEGPVNQWPFGAYRKIAVTFIILSVLSLAAVAYFSLIKLDIVVVPSMEAAKANATFTVYDRPESYTVPAGNTLGLVREMEVESEKTFTASEEKALGASVSGTVTIINKSPKDQPLVASTRLLSPTNQLLRIKDSVIVPAGGSVKAAVYSDSIDPSFTLADARLTIPGLWAGLQESIYAEAKAGDVTYREKVEKTVTQSDIDSAIGKAKETLLEKAATDIEQAYGAYDQKLYALDEASITHKTSAKAGDTVDEFTVSFSGKLTIVAFKSADVDGVLRTALSSSISTGRSLGQSEKPLFRLVSADPTQNIAEVEASVVATAKVDDGVELIDRRKIVSLTRNQLEDYLDAQTQIQSYELHFQPSFWKFTPQLVDRINVTVK